MGIYGDNVLNLRFKGFTDIIQENLEEVQIKHSYSDVTLVCGDKQFQAHKIMLSFASPFLRNILKVNSNRNHTFYFTGTTPNNLENLLTYIYHGKVKISENDLDSFLDLTAFLGVGEHFSYPTSIESFPKRHKRVENEFTTQRKLDAVEEPMERLNNKTQFNEIKLSKKDIRFSQEISEIITERSDNSCGRYADMSLPSVQSVTIANTQSNKSTFQKPALNYSYENKFLNKSKKKASLVLNGEVTEERIKKKLGEHNQNVLTEMDTFSQEYSEADTGKGDNFYEKPPDDTLLLDMRSECKGNTFNNRLPVVNSFESIPSIMTPPIPMKNNDLNTPTHSLNAEAVGGETVLEKDSDELDGEEDDTVSNNPSKPKSRGTNREYDKMEHFETKDEFNKFWHENNFLKEYNYHDKGRNYLGEYELYRCKYYKKSGYSSCRGQIKVVFPDYDNSVVIYKSQEEHNKHEPIGDPKQKTRFVWKENAEADKIVREAVAVKEFPCQIKLRLDKAGIDPMPTSSQLNTRIGYLRGLKDIHLNVQTSKDFKDLNDQDLEEPVDIQKATKRGKY